MSVFINENVARRLPQNGQFQVGRSDVDPGTNVEQGIALPFPQDPATSWLYFDGVVGVMLDSGIVVHSRLPQVNKGYDTLASCNLDDPNWDQLTTSGVRLTCKDQYTDIIQRMGHSRYWFRIWGQGLRAGYRVPIPGLKTIGGVPAIPYDKNPQWAFCRIAPGGNYSGVILWHAQWSLWYTTSVPPNNNTIPAADPAARVSGVNPLPTSIEPPFSIPDDDARSTGPITLGNIIQA
jgi:hypothetical protein